MKPSNTVAFVEGGRYARGQSYPRHTQAVFDIADYGGTVLLAKKLGQVVPNLYV
jgi:hypothetical protein